MLARLIANFHRRQVSREEKEEWINGLAKIYREQGLRVSLIKRDGIENQIKHKIMETTGLSEVTISRYLHEEFKQEAPQGGAHITSTPLEKAESCNISLVVSLVVTFSYEKDVIKIIDGCNISLVVSLVVTLAKPLPTVGIGL